MPRCLIPNFTNNAENNISIRCRRPDTTAIWAPNTVGNLCDIHADEGYTIDITFTPSLSAHTRWPSDCLITYPFLLITMMLGILQKTVVFVS